MSECVQPPSFRTVNISDRMRGQTDLKEKKKATYVQIHAIKLHWYFKMSWSSLPITVLLKLKSCPRLSNLHHNLGRHGWARSCLWFFRGKNVSYLAGPYVLPAGCGQRPDTICRCTLLTVVWGNSWVILTPNSHFQSKGEGRKRKGLLLKPR